MKITFSILAFLYLLNLQVNAQYKFNPQKVTAIRWRQIPEKVESVTILKIDLNGQWNFSTSPEMDFWKKDRISGWITIEVPGEWVMQGFEVENGKAAGYLCNFQIPPSWKKSRIKLKCEAVFSDCEIWINGKTTGSHLGGFTPCEVDVTNHLQQGENTIALKVISESIADTLSSASKYAVHPVGGITWPIYLIALPEINIASFDVSTVFDKNYSNATLNAELTVANKSRVNQNSELKLTLKDANGIIVAKEGESKLIKNTEAGEMKKVYPEDHFGRLEGTAKLFYPNEICGLAGPSKKPDWTYNMDQTRFGSNDFRLTKRNVLTTSVTSENTSVLKVNSDGLQHIRCWTKGPEYSGLHLLIAEYDNPGAERFLRELIDHSSQFDIPQKQGQTIKGNINLQILNAKQ